MEDVMLFMWRKQLVKYICINNYSPRVALHHLLNVF